MTVQEIAEQSLKSLLASLGFSADIEVTETDGIVCLNISSPDSQYIIGGRRGTGWMTFSIWSTA